MSSTPVFVPSDRVLLSQARRRVSGLELELTSLEYTHHMTVTALAETKKKLLTIQRVCHKQEEELTKLRLRNKALETQLLTNSSNSSLPPSKDKPGNREYPKREKTGRAQGGQKGHIGTTLNRLQPTETVHLPTPDKCSKCENCTPTLLKNTTRQVQEIQIKVNVTDYVGTNVTWACGHTDTSAFPTEAKSPVSYGNGTKALAVGLACIGVIPPRVVARLFDGFFGMNVSKSTVSTWTHLLGNSLIPWTQQMRQLLSQSTVLHADETPIRVKGCVNAHVHVAASDTGTLFHVAGRKKEDILAGGILGDYKGTLVSDGLISYWSVTPSECLHQTCIAHLIRYAKGRHKDFLPNDVNTPHPVPQFEQLHELFSKVIHEKNSGRVPAVPMTETKRLLEDCMAVLDNQPGSSTVKTAKTLCNSINKHLNTGDLYRFLTDPTVPATNNEAERALRPAKVKQKRSGTFQSLAYARSYMLVNSYLDTARKNGKDPTWILKQALAGAPYIPDFETEQQPL